MSIFVLQAATEEGVKQEVDAESVLDKIKTKVWMYTLRITLLNTIRESRAVCAGNIELLT